MGGPDMAPQPPPTFGAPRHSRVAPLNLSLLGPPAASRDGSRASASRCASCRGFGYTPGVPNTERGSGIRTSRDAGHRAANRGVDIVELLATRPDGLALRDVSAQLEAPKSSLLPLLRALTARGYLAQGRGGEYRLGAGALDLG